MVLYRKDRAQSHIHPNPQRPKPQARPQAKPARAGQIKLSSLVTHRFPLEVYETYEAYEVYKEAYQVLRDNSGASRGKVILDASAP